MRVALPVREGLIEKKAEGAESIALYDIEEGEILSEEKLDAAGEENIVALLKEREVEAFICLSLGAKMVIDLALGNIEIIGGVRGRAADAVRKFASGTLEEDDFELDCVGAECIGDCSRCH